MSQHDFHQLVLGNAPQLRLTIAANGDHHDSRLEWVHESRTTVLLTSPNFEAHGDWPPAPPIQECRRHSQQQHVLLATGAAGKAHWSASIETDEDAGWIMWDVACRTSREPKRLGTEWLVAAGWSATDVDGSVVIQGDHETRLVISPKNDSRIQVTSKDDQVRISILPPEEQVALPHTFRWKYGIRQDS